MTDDIKDLIDGLRKLQEEFNGIESEDCNTYKVLLIATNYDPSDGVEMGPVYDTSKQPFWYEISGFSFEEACKNADSKAIIEKANMIWGEGDWVSCDAFGLDKFEAPCFTIRE